MPEYCLTLHALGRHSLLVKIHLQASRTFEMERHDYLIFFIRTAT